ncbi:restriction endonuclease subunit S [Salegentibacter sp. LM13S]|uniref:restriction endonuclease subunit S n=1 Tax=Salegentibacter lacus TaxID=2873599 RepID=UPI001CCF5F63|nr:restriction endonuclease subunit S [Salegentibacter lacus]MBZ9632196.1 restriction endonuclease subunit S [Salegentibacter lacus]
MGKWQKKAISEVYDVRDGTHDSPKYLKEGYPLVTSKNLKNNEIELSNVKYISQDDYDSINKRSNVEIGDVLFAMIGTIGNPVLIKEEPNYAIKNVALFKKKDVNQDSKFLTYYLGFEKTIEKMTSEARGATQKFVGLTYLRDFKIPLPSLPEQISIVAKLDGLFEKIDRAIGLLKENIAHTDDLMGSMLDGLFDKIYANYKTVPLLKHVDFVGGSQPPKSSFSYEKKEGYVRLIQIRDYKSDKHLVYIKEDSTKKFCEEDDVMIGRYGPPVFQILRGIKGAYNVALMKAIPDEEVIIKDYLYYFLMNGKIQNYIISISQRSAGQSGVNKKALEAYEIAIPPMEVQKKIVAIIKAAIPKINKTQNLTRQNLENLKALKNSLLDQAFKGEL